MLQEILEFLPYLLLFLFLRSILKSFVSNRKRPRPAPQRQAPVSLGGELKKDPVCGTYVPITASLTRSVNGQVVYFCSKECRDRYNPYQYPALSYCLTHPGIAWNRFFERRPRFKRLILERLHE